MSYNLSADERKQLFEKEIPALTNTIASFTLLDLDKEAAYKVKKLVAVEDELSSKQLLNLSFRKNVDFVIQNSVQTLTDKIKIIGQLDKDINAYYRETFSFFSKPSVRHKIVFDSSIPRKRVMNLAFHRLQIDIEANRSANLKTAIEEMVMNAQIDAKKLSDPKSNYKSSLILEKCDKLVAVSVIDTYGTLVYSKFLGQVESCMDIGISSSINQNRQKGAGVGSTLIFNAMDSLYLGCIPGEKTRVSAIIPFGLSEKNQEKLQKSIFLL